MTSAASHTSSFAPGEDIGVDFPGDGPGEEMRIRAWRFRGGGTGPSVHLQAGIHAGEIAGMIALHELLPILAEAARQGTLKGDVTIVPQANPLGLRQHRQERHAGRFHDATSRNFNRHFPASIAHPEATAHSAWQSALFGLSRDADIVLDLHTDEEALPYLYLHKDFWPAWQALPACLGSAVAILWEGEAGTTFEDAALARLRRRPGDGPRLVATIELRGEADTDPATTRADIEGVLAFLRHVGTLEGAAALPAWSGLAVPAAHMETVFAPVGGILSFTRALGENLAAGDEFARLLPQAGGAWISLCAPQAGRLVTRLRDRITAKGTVIAKLTGTRPAAGYTGGALDDPPAR